MTAFIVGAALLALLAVLFVALPLLWRRSGSQPAAIAAMVSALGLIIASVVVYSELGNPAGIRVTPAHANAASKQVAALMRHLERMPNDLPSWLELGAAYDSNEQYQLALHAYDHANTVANGTNADALAGIGEALLLGGDDQQAAQAPAYLEHALQLDPKQPKALWLSGLLAFRGGNLDVARARFAAMLTLSPPPPANVSAALQRVIAQIDLKLHPAVDAATAIQLHVLLSPALAAKVPPNASLFVFVQAPGGGAPLAVKRSSASLPQDVVLSSDDAMVAQNTVHPGQKVTVVARISSSGSPLARSGDPYGQIDYIAGKSGPRYLKIDKLSP